MYIRLPPSPGLQDEIFGNVASIVAFNLSAKDAMAVRKEFLEEPLNRLTEKPAQPVLVERLVALRPGQAMGRLGGGAFALPLRTLDPLPEPSAAYGERIRSISWETYGATPFGEQAKRGAGNNKRVPASSEEFLE